MLRMIRGFIWRVAATYSALNVAGAATRSVYGDYKLSWDEKRHGLRSTCSWICSNTRSVPCSMAATSPIPARLHLQSALTGALLDVRHTPKSGCARLGAPLPSLLPIGASRCYCWWTSTADGPQHDRLHRLTTHRADACHWWRWRRFARRSDRLDYDAACRHPQLVPQHRQYMPLPPAEPAIIAYLHKPLRQDMLQKASDERQHG